MLVLGRKQDERILIGSDIVVTVVRISEFEVKLGIEAPKSMAVDREEIRRSKEQDIEKGSGE